jgi:NADPH-dependent curcumin reductase CurA
VIAGREVRLASRPVGEPSLDDFELAEVTVPDPADGELVVRNAFMSVDPYMRGRMSDRKSYVPPFEVGQPLQGGAIGRVVASRAQDVPEGAWVQSNLGWREFASGPARAFQVVDPGHRSPSLQLGALGGPGFTAYVGLLDIGQPQPGETVFVSAAAGAVGTIVGQLAKIHGCRVIGSAGSAEKLDVLREIGFDEAFDYKAVDVREALAAAAPDGVDVYFDNVGGDHLEAALDVMNPFGRIPVCGMISLYNATEPQPGPRNLFLIIGKRLLLKGFIISDHMDRRQAFIDEVGGHLDAGRLVVKETVEHGIERAPNAFIGMLRGANVGKMLVQLDPEVS